MIQATGRGSPQAPPTSFLEEGYKCRKVRSSPRYSSTPGDWRKSIDVQSLSFHDRGVWFEMLMLMHDSERRGVLILNGRPMTDEMIARCIGLDNQTFNQTLTTLLTSGVAEREQESGAVMSRRMVRDENLRKIRSEAGSKGGNPALLIQKPTIRDKQNSTPSSSSSSSYSKVKTQKPTAESVFQIPDWMDAELWDSYLEVRKKKRAVMTDRALRGIVAHLQRFAAKGLDPMELLGNSIRSNWIDIYEPKGGNTSATNRANIHESKWERAHRLLNEEPDEEGDSEADSGAGGAAGSQRPLQ